jgi:hypothetical protein
MNGTVSIFQLVGKLPPNRTLEKLCFMLPTVTAIEEVVPAPYRQEYQALSLRQGVDLR